jgi:hypothetical protein
LGGQTGGSSKFKETVAGAAAATNIEQMIKLRSRRFIEVPLARGVALEEASGLRVHFVKDSALIHSFQNR